MKINIALAGNPNSGKTTMFNDLTGSYGYVGNWPGVTVEKKEGKLIGNKDINILDLPGIYSLSPYTNEEVVARNYLINDKPDVIINIIDAVNIERNLYLTTQLAELNIPMVLVLNRMDMVKKNGDKINISIIEKMLGLKIIEASAIKGIGSFEAVEFAASLASKKESRGVNKLFSTDVEVALGNISQIIKHKQNCINNIRWYAIKLFERDKVVYKNIGLSKEEICEIEKIISSIENKLDDDCESIISAQRYDFIEKTVKHALTKRGKKNSFSEKLDAIATGRFTALPLFAFIMCAVYYFSISIVGSTLSEWLNIFFNNVLLNSTEEFLININTEKWLNSLIIEGIIPGVCAVLGFLPQILALFLCLGILEDCGYMSRIAFILDKFFRSFGLSGKSFIPMLIGTGCSVPGIMASRTIESESDRKMTIMTTSFIPCGAKLPIITLIAGALFQNGYWVAPAAYLIGVFSVLISGLILKKTRMFSEEPAPFIMELPPYKTPDLKGVFLNMWDKGKSFVQKAGTVILIASVVIWFLMSFNFSFKMVDAIEDSILASLGNIISPVFAPLGFGDYRMVIASMTGFAAKENILSTMAILFGSAEGLDSGFYVGISASITPLAGFSFLVFNLLNAPCVAAVAAIYKEIGTIKGLLYALCYQTIFAYLVSFIIYQLGSFIINGQFTAGTLFVFLTLAFIIMYVFAAPNINKTMRKSNVI